MPNEVISLRRPSQQVTWGFSIFGGRDFSAPLTIQKVTPDGLAAKSNLHVGDLVLKIGQIETGRLAHHEARDAIISQGNSLDLTVQRGPSVSVQNNNHQQQQQQDRPVEPVYVAVPTPVHQQQFSPQQAPPQYTPKTVCTPQHHSPQQPPQPQPVFSPRPSFEPPKMAPMPKPTANSKVTQQSTGKSFNRGLKGSASMKAADSTSDIPVCYKCNNQIRGPFISAIGKVWCPQHFKCDYPDCGVNLFELGFVEEDCLLYCEQDFARYFAPRCGKCKLAVTGNCVYALEQAFHPECFACKHCKKSIGNDGFHLEDGHPYCISDYEKLFTTKCVGCEFPIQSGDRFLEAINAVWHVECFCCSTCQRELEKIGFVVKANKPYCKKHAYSGERKI